MGTYICPRKLSALRREQVSESEAWGKLLVSRNRSCPRTNILVFCQIEAIVLLVSFNFFLQQVEKCLQKTYFSVFSGMTLWTNECFPSSVRMAKLNSSWIKWKTNAFIVVDVRFENMAILLRIYLHIFLSFNWNILHHMTCWDQMCTSTRCIWWIIITLILIFFISF